MVAIGPLSSDSGIPESRKVFKSMESNPSFSENLAQEVLSFLPPSDLRKIEELGSEFYRVRARRVIKLREHRPVKQLVSFLLKNYKSELNPSQIGRLGQIERLTGMGRSSIPTNISLCIHSLTRTKENLLDILKDIPTEILESILGNPKAPSLLKEIYPLIEIYKEIDGVTSVSDCVNCIRKLFQHRAFAKAFKVADKIPAGLVRDRVYKIIAKAASDAGEFELAIKAAGKITAGRERDEAYGYIAKYVAAAGKFEVAIRIANRISNSSLRGLVYEGIAKSAAAAGKLRLLIEAADYISNIDLKDQLYESIVKAAIAAGEFRLVVKVADKISFCFTRYKYYFEASNRYTAGNIKSLARRMDPRNSCNALLGLVSVLTAGSLYALSQRYFQEDSDNS